MKKKLLTALSIALILIVGIVGTIAYLTDRDSEVNVFTMGEVEIDLSEDFEQGSKLQPGKEIKKEVTIANTGKTDAYVWYTFAVPAVADDAIDVVCSTDGWKTPEKTGEVTVDGITYNIYTCKYNTLLAPGAETKVGMQTVKLSSAVDYNKNDGKYYTVVNGVATEVPFDLAKTVIYVNGFGIQADGFDNFDSAYTAYYSQWGSDNGEYPTVVGTAGDEVELTAGNPVVLTNRTEPITVSGEGTLILDKADITATEGAAVAVKAGSNVTISFTGKNNVTGATGNAGIEVAEGASLELTGDTLKVAGNGGKEEKGSSNGGNGIGGAGSIYIHDVDGLIAEGYGKHGFGIGGNTTEITIEDTTIEYVKGGYVQPNFESDPSYGKSEPEGGAAIGTSCVGGVITLNNVTIEEALGGSKAAGIGVSYWGSATINISNSTIKKVAGGNASAGIGGSRVQRDQTVPKPININIVDSEITAFGGQYAAGIGSGYDTYCHGVDVAPVCTINIKGNSIINATGGKYAAGIGTGHHAGALAGVIEETVTVTAKAGGENGEAFYKDSYTTAQDVGFGVLDPAREAKDNSYSINYKGTIITVPEVQ